MKEEKVEPRGSRNADCSWAFSDMAMALLQLADRAKAYSNVSLDTLRLMNLWEGLSEL